MNYNQTETVQGMTQTILLVLMNLGETITSILSTMWGKIIILALFISSIFAPISNLFHIIVALTVLDAIFGINVAIKKGGKGEILSSKLRVTVYKLFFYILFLVFAFFIEAELSTKSYLTTKIIFAIMSSVELWSIAANALILVPDFPFLKLFSRFLTAEIGKKMDLSQEEVESIMRTRKKKEKKEEKEKLEEENENK